MLKSKVYGGSWGSEDGIELEKYGNEQAGALELMSIAHPTKKAGNLKQETTIV